MHAASSGAHVKHVTMTKPAVSYVVSRLSTQLATTTYRHDLGPELFYINGLQDQCRAASLNAGRPTARLE